MGQHENRSPGRNNANRSFLIVLALSSTKGCIQMEVIFTSDKGSPASYNQRVKYLIIVANHVFVYLFIAAVAGVLALSFDM